MPSNTTSAGRWIASFLVCLAVLRVGPSALGAAEDVRGSIKPTVDAACRWLAERQNPDGGYGPYGETNVRIPNTSDLGITAFCLYALARNPRGYKEVDGPFISKAVDFLLKRQQADGAFCDPKDPTLKNYKTSVVLLALHTLWTRRIIRKRIVRKRRRFLLWCIIRH